MANNEKKTLAIDLSLNDKLSRSLKGATTAIKAFGRSAARTFKAVGRVTASVLKGLFSLKTAVLALVSAATIGAFKKLSDSVDAVAKQAQGIGESVENLSLLTAAFTQAGGEAENLKTILVAITRATVEAQDPLSRAAKTFAKMGIGIDDLKKLSPAQLFERMALGLEEYNTQGEKAQVLQQLFPEQFLRLVPLIGNGLDEFQAAVRRVDQVGARVTRDQAAVAESLSNAFGEVALALGGIGRELLTAFGPPAIAALEAMAEWLGENRDNARQLAIAIGDGVVTAISLGVDAIIGLVRAIESIPGVSLLDEDAAAKQIRKLERDLRIVSEIRTGALRKERERLRAIIDDPTQFGLGTKHARRASEALPGLNFEIARASSARPSTVERLLGTESEMRQQLESLRAVLEGGLALQLEQSKNTIADKIGGAFREVRDRLKQDGEDVVDVGVGSEEKLSERIQKLQTVFDAARKGVEDVKDAGSDTGSTSSGAAVGFLENLQKSLERMKAQVTDFAGFVGASLGNLANRGVDGFANAFGNVIARIQTAKDAFKDFARAFLVDIARMIAKAVALGTIKTLFALESGGVTPGVEDTKPIRKFARGGIARRPTLAVFGEGRTSEAFVPLPDNRSIPVTFTGGSGSTNGVVNIHITAMDSKDVRRALVEQQGTLRSIWTTQAETRHGMRQVIRRAAS